MPRESRDCAEDPKILERAYAERPNREDIAELEALIGSEAKGRRIVLDLKNLTLVGQDAIAFLDRCEANGITLKNCAAYIHEWIKGQRGES